MAQLKKILKANNCNQYYMIDLEDYPKIKDKTWSLKKQKNKPSYIRTSKWDTKKKNSVCIFLHHVIYGGWGWKPPNNKKIDHVNCISTDNRRSNLRLVSNSENMQNRDICQRNNKTFLKLKELGIKIKDPLNFLNIHYDKERNKWKVGIKVQQKYYRKRFDIFKIEEALEWRNMMRRKYFKERANI